MNEAQNFLTRDEQKRIIDCVKGVERATSGELVPVIASQSYHYPGAVSFGSLIVGVAVGVGASLCLNSSDMWMFLAIFLAVYLLCMVLMRAVPVFKKPFIPKQQMRDEVHEGAVTSFFLNGLHRTRDMTGIIIYVSVYERMVEILADKGINDKVDPKVWDEVVQDVTQAIRKGEPADGICRAVTRCGELITENFPIKPDDVDELPNLIVDGKPVE